MRKVLIAAMAVLAIALAAVSQALASTVTIRGGDTVRVLESGDQRNRIAVSYDSGVDAYTVSDAAANLAATGACAAVDSHTATCTGAGIREISVDAGARDDEISIDQMTVPASVSEDVDGGGGSDQVSGAHGTIAGGSGNDVVVGSPLAENIRGGSGRDLLDGGDGPDDIEGGRGTDTLVYPAARVTPIAVTIGFGSFDDGGVEDEVAGRRDTVHGDVEAVIGTPQDDFLAGDGSSETLTGARQRHTARQLRQRHTARQRRQRRPPRRPWTRPADRLARR